MTLKSRPLIAGNWKMNGLSSSLGEARAIGEALSREPVRARVAICPPATLIERLSRTLDGLPVEVGGQEVHAEPAGAHTGDISGDMLADAGATLVIVGHSERRTAYRQTDADVAAKVKAAQSAGLYPLLCVGETLAEREAGQALEIVSGQVRGSLPAGVDAAAFAVAYEPIWAIGSGAIPTIAEIEQVHGVIRQTLVETLGEAARRSPILYGGSVKPENVAVILQAREVGGALVGGASLKAVDFLAIVRACDGL
jgi:triosephosphate isomerase